MVSPANGSVNLSRVRLTESEGEGTRRAVLISDDLWFSACPYEGKKTTSKYSNHLANVKVNVRCYIFLLPRNTKVENFSPAAEGILILFGGQCQCALDKYLFWRERK